MSVSIVVMAHPKRAAAAERLAAELNGCPIVWDRVGQVAETCHRALQAYDRDATHHLIVQDDAILAQDVPAAVELASDACGPEMPFSLYTGWTKPRVPVGDLVRRALPKGYPWVETRGPIWGVAIAHPVKLLPTLLNWYPQFAIKQDDSRLARCYGVMGVYHRFLTTSIVDHDPGEKSLTKPGFFLDTRHAEAFVGRDTSALEINYHGPVLQHPGLNRRRVR